MNSVPRITEKELLNLLGTNNQFDTRVQLVQLVLELVNGDYSVENLKKDILIYNGAF